MGEWNWLRSEAGWQTACRSIKAADLPSEGSHKLWNPAQEPGIDSRIANLKCFCSKATVSQFTIGALNSNDYQYLIVKTIKCDHLWGQTSNLHDTISFEWWPTSVTDTQSNLGDAKRVKRMCLTHGGVTVLRSHQAGLAGRGGSVRDPSITRPEQKAGVITLSVHHVTPKLDS